MVNGYESVRVPLVVAIVRLIWPQAFPGLEVD
jgi:hypothetical protein